MDGPAQENAPPNSRKHRLVNEEYAAQYLTSNACWHRSHGTTGPFLGGAMLYYAFAYALRARIAVCLGSGGGFVPRVLRQAQRDLRLARSRTFLVDANRQEAGWGCPNWLSKDSLFRKEFPEVTILLNT